MTEKKKPDLRSFLIGGFECADHVNRLGRRVNLQRHTQHDVRVYQDYAEVKKLGISVVREGVCWSVVEKEPYVYDFSHLLAFYDAAQAHHIQIIWDLCHFGYPDGLFPTHPHFCNRFKAFAEAFCQFHLQHSKDRLWVVPINEISYLSWFSGEARGTVPFATNLGWNIKYQLCRANIKAIGAIKERLPKAVVLAVEPLIRVHSTEDPGSADRVRDKNASQYQAVDILLGKSCPELGGAKEMIDLLGINYYVQNQWNEQNQMVPWPDEKGRRVPFADLLKEVYERYQLPLLITETGHVGNQRSEWIQEIADESILALRNNVDLRGICLYPIIDRPDWDNLFFYYQAGVWNLNKNKDRIPYMPYLKMVKQLQEYFKNNGGYSFQGGY